MIDRWSPIADLVETGADIPDGGPTALGKVPHEDDIRRALKRIARDCASVVALVNDIKKKLRTAGFDDVLYDRSFYAGYACWYVDREYGLVPYAELNVDEEILNLRRAWHAAKPKKYCEKCGDEEPHNILKNARFCSYCEDGIAPPWKQKD